MTEPIGVFAVTAVGRTAAWLDISCPPPIRPERTKHGGGVESPRPHFHVIGLQDHAALRTPVTVEREDEVLEAQAQRFASGNIVGALWPMRWRGASEGSACSA